MPMNIVEIVEKQLQQMLQPKQRAAVALSGGRDSVCLLHMMQGLAHRLSIHLMAVHVHHGLRAEAYADEAFCRELCRNLGIELVVEQVNVPTRVRQTGETVEEAARVLRYQVFERLVQSGKADRILLAHHQQDQAETVLLHLLRGSGLTGLGGMKAQRLPYLRPMLEVPKAEIDAYVQTHDLPFVEDASNMDTAYRRNHIRHKLLPLLEQEYNPEIVTALSRMATLLQEEEAFLEEQVPQVPEGERLEISLLEQYPTNLQRRILRKWLRQNGLESDVQLVHLQQLMDLAQGATGRRISLPKGLTVQKSYDILILCKSGPESDKQGLLQEHGPAMPQEAPSFEMDWMSMAQARSQWGSREQVPALPEEKWLSADELTELPVWRTRRPGDYITLGSGRKKLKEFMIDAKIPREERERIPLLTVGSQVLWVYGYRISEAVKITENTQRVLHVRRIKNGI